MVWTHISCSSSTFLAVPSSFNIDNGSSSGQRGRKLSSLPIACVTSNTPSSQNLPKPPSPPSLFLANNNARPPWPLFAQRQIGRKAARQETVIPDPDYRIPIVLLGLAGISLYGDNLLAAAPIGLLGLLLLFQTTRVRFVFDEEALEVKVGEQLQESSENVFVGGKNRWKYSTFVNWELWWPNFPILVYFKEMQTRPEGQVHFFPVIFNGRQLYDVMVERAGTSQTSGPKGS